MDLHTDRCGYELEPGVSICETLASICRGEFESEYPSVEQRPSSRVRGSTPQQGHLARRKQAWGHGSTKSPPTDRPCSSDMRGYSSLEELLSTNWEKPADLDQQWAWAEEPSDEFMSMSAADHGSSGTLTRWGDVSLTDWHSRPSSRAEACLLAPRSRKNSVEPLSVARPRSRAKLTAVTKARGEEFRTSEEWLVATHMAGGAVDIQAMQGLSGTVSRCGPPNNKGDATRPQSRCAPPKNKGDATRPQSPLQPGVYVGHGQEQPIFPRRTLLAFNAEAAPPTLATMTSRTRTFNGVTVHNQKAAGILKTPMRARLPPKELKLREEEDLERIAKDKERYLQWKRKVIESARNLQIEVSRFRVET